MYKLQQVVNTYNDSPHSSLGGLTPNEAQHEKYHDMLFELNIEKQTHNRTVSDLQPGDMVRILDTHIFKKGTEPKFSEETYKVVKAQGGTITIDENGHEVKYKRDKLLKVPSD